MAFSKITTRGMSGDTLEAGDIAANAIGASELADNAVDAGAIASGAVTAAKVADGLIEVKPHIKPGILQPAYQGHLLGKSNPIVDSSDSAHAVINTNYVINNSDPKVGVGYLNDNGTTGSGGSFLKIGDDNDADFQFGTGAFTIEYWVKEDDYDYGDHGHFTTSQGAVGWAIQRAGTYLYFTAQGDAFGSAPTSGNKIIARANLSGHVSNNTWYHVAIVRVSTSNLKIYINGTDRTAEADAGGTWGFAWDNTSNDTELVLGRSYPTSEEKHNVGGFDAIRITKGLAVYTGNFTAPTANLTTTWSAGTNIAANSTASNVKLLLNANGETNGLHSGAYGTAQVDGHSYYYTDIKGSKPIKDPRIGAHFGSQRHTFRSIQKLDQETAMNGNNVYSVDGREWCRMVGSTWVEQNGNDGLRYYTDTVGNFVEITGYFSGANYLTFSSTTNDIALAIDGTTDTATYTGGTSALDSPLRDRYVNMSVCVNLAFSSAPTLGIHTLKIFVVSGDYIRIEGIELIAQDTTSTANKSKIQIPSQNVVSYGKKFTVSGTPHYNPFNGMSGAKTLSELGTYIDTATSLGMDNWKGGTSNYYKPFNGGRVVKWVDSSGTIKTSVTMMPPNAQNEGQTASNAVTNTEIQNSTNGETINFDTGGIDHSLSEVAKTYMVHEFGNGSANGAPGSTWQDATMVDGTERDITYVMDDGLTSLFANNVAASTASSTAGNNHIYRTGAASYYVHTFIGTGITLDLYWGTYPSKTIVHIAQNLPYSTHILKNDVKDSAVNEMEFTLNGVSLGDSVALGNTPMYGEITFHQPKKPPVPEDACILADYMLMADFVKTGTSGMDAMSKGVRKISTTRDLFVDSSAALGANVEVNTAFSYFLRSFSSGSAKVTTKIPAFASEVTWQGEMGTASINSSENSWGGNAITMAQASGGTNTTEIITYSSGTKPELGMNNFQHLTQNGGYRTNAMEIATPIHTSSHYQEFETPYLKELVGGDRNMEQTNLVVTADGKSWDEVTRDTSYIGNIVFSGSKDSSQNTLGIYILDEWRGTGGNASAAYFNKDFAISYDRWICLKDGWYKIFHQFHTNDSINTSDYCRILVNGVRVGQVYQADQNYIAMGMNVFASAYINRGDYVQIYGGSPGGDEESYIFQIIRL